MIQLFEMHLTVSEEEMRTMQRDLDQIKDMLGTCALVTCFQDALDSAEKTNENSPNIPEAHTRAITIALAGGPVSRKTRSGS